MSYKGFASACSVPVNKVLMKIGLMNADLGISGTYPSPTTAPTLTDTSVYYALKAGFNTKP